MIIAVTINSRLNPDSNVSHRAEVVVDNEAEAKLAGFEFWHLMSAFNEGLSQAAEEATP